MAMSTGTGGGMSSEINVTPMIDVLLVLLIIFMVIVPSLPRGESALLPRAPMNLDRPTPQAVVLEVLKGNAGKTSFRINQQYVAKENLSARLAAIYANRAERILFLKGDDQLSFNEIADVIDTSHAAGIDHVGLMTPKGMAGQ
jgi:biopolymer transport protein ExbD